MGERYRVGKMLGQGGFGVVFEVFDEFLDERLALKFIHPDRQEGLQLKRLKRELELARQINSHRLVKVFQLEESGGYIFLVMEFISGRDLKSVLAEESPLSISQALTYGRRILRALQDLHEKEIIHRDIKPANVLVEEEGRLLVADLGLARSWSTDSRLTETSATIGTPAYLFPEHGRGRLTPAADLYSFGVLLFEMLTGRLPFEAEGTVGMLNAHLFEPAPDLRKWRRDAPAWLAKLVARLLEKRPEDRYQSAEEVLEDLSARRVRARLPRYLWGVLFLLVGGMVSKVFLSQSKPAAVVTRQLDHVRPVSGGGFEAVSSTGEVLWNLPSSARGGVVKARLEANRPPCAIGVIYSDDPVLAEERLWLTTYDGLTGEPIDRIRLHDPGPIFDDFGFSRWYTVTVKGTDLNGDGVDEIWITHDHQIYWPSVTQLYQPDIRTLWPVLRATGRHQLIGFIDADGDGQKDPLFAGINNLLGFRLGIVAVDLDPPLGQPISAGFPGRTTLLPNDPSSQGLRNDPLWYTLLPLGVNTRIGDIDFDADEGLVTLESISGQVVIDATGRRNDSSILQEERRWSLAEAYNDFRRADRLDSRFQGKEARLLFQKIVVNSRGVGEDSLATEAETRIVESLILGGRYREAEIQAGEFSASLTPFSRYELSFRMGTAFYLASQPESALRWFRQTIDFGIDDSVVRLSWEPIEGAILALVELERFQEAESLITQLIGSGELSPRKDNYRGYIQWQQGLEPTTVTSNPNVADLTRYWALEFRRERGEPLDSLLLDVQRELQVSSETQGLVLALYAQLLHASDPTKAERLCQRADTWLKLFERKNVAARSHAGLVRSRCSPIQELDR